MYQARNIYIARYDVIKSILNTNTYRGLSIDFQVTYYMKHIMLM